MIERGVNVGIVDTGARATVLAEAYAKSPHVNRVYVIPGNDMVAQVSKKVEPVSGVVTTDKSAIEEIIDRKNIKFLDVAADEPIKSGVADLARGKFIATMGPSASAGRIETDKEHARDVGTAMSIPQPEYHVFRDIDVAREFLENREEKPIFVKAAGLARGKGVRRAENRDEALDVIRRLRSEFPNAMERFLLEEPIDGKEEFSSFYALSIDGVKHLGDAQDHKKEYDGDHGENTGGMGAVSHPLVADEIIDFPGKNWVAQQIFDFHQKLVKDPYIGIFYPSFMKTIDPLGYSLVEFNARWGDPEAQVIIPGLDFDYFEFAIATVMGNLRNFQIKDDGKVRVTTTLAARGYPRTNSAEYKASQEKKLESISELQRIDGIKFYGAGIAVEDQEYYIKGGRLGNIVAVGYDVIEARQKIDEALEIVKSRDGENVVFRTDIGHYDLDRLRGRSV